MCLPLPLQGENGKCPSSSTVQNITTLKVPSFDHAPYRAGSEHAKLAVCVGMRGAGGWVAGWAQPWLGHYYACCIMREKCCAPHVGSP